MTWRGPAAWIALLLGGGVVGVLAAYALETVPEASGRPAPVAAVSPSVPVDPAPSLRPDPTAPPLGTGLALREVGFGTGGFRKTVPVPVGWTRSESALNEVKYKLAGNPSNTFVLRLEQVLSQRETIEDILADRVVELREQEERVTILDRTSDSLEFTYVFDGYLRHGFLRWLDLSGSGTAEVEVAVNGREVDVEGARELLDRVSAGIRAG